MESPRALGRSDSNRRLSSHSAAEPERNSPGRPSGPFPKRENARKMERDREPRHGDSTPGQMTSEE